MARTQPLCPNNISFSGLPTGLRLSEATHQMMGQQAHFSLDEGNQPSKYTRKGHRSFASDWKIKSRLNECICFLGCCERSVEAVEKCIVLPWPQ